MITLIIDINLLQKSYIKYTRKIPSQFIKAMAWEKKSEPNIYTYRS